MDLTAFDANDAGELREGDWLALDYDLPSTSARSGLSQYELLTGLGARFERDWGSSSRSAQAGQKRKGPQPAFGAPFFVRSMTIRTRSEEKTSELQSLMPRTYAVSCLKKTTPSSLQDHIRTY